MKVVYNSIIPFAGFSAINLFGVVFARKEYEPLSAPTINHEAIHTAQMRELWYIPFYLWYVLEWFVKLFLYGKRAYHHISFEREAYAKMYYAGYLGIRKRFASFGYIGIEN